MVLVVSKEPMRQIRLTPATIASAAGLICLLVYLRTLGCDFVSYDDPDYVLNNPLIRHLDLRLVVSVFSESYNGWWMPLTWISLAIDYHFWELHPLGYHLTNILLHSVNTGLVVLIAGKIWAQIQGQDSGDRLAGDDPACQRRRDYLYPLTLLLAGLLWGIHPLRVESVAWVTERKDVLNGTFSLASILLYLRYAQGRAGDDRRAWGVYLLSLLMFALSLMAKSVSVVLPLMLLVIDWYPLNRLQRERIFPVLAEKLPFLLMSVAITIVTIRITSQVGYLVPYSVFPLTQRLAVSGNALFEYFRLMLYPIGILPFYLIPDPIPVSFTIKTVIFASVAIFCFRVRSRHPWLPAMLLLFLLPLMPVLALFQNGDQALAARFTYLPSLAPTIAVVLAGAMICSTTLKTVRWKSLCGAGALVAVLLYAAVTIRDIAVWQDSVSLWTRVIDLQPEVASYKERGKLYAARGDYRAAVDDFSAAIGMASGVWQHSIYNLYAYRGETYRSMGRYPEAVQDFTTAISFYPHPVYYHYRGIALQQSGQLTAAAEDFAKAGGATGPLDWFERADR
jgi:tetratricopeptide (TPR) repeat protein